MTRAALPEFLRTAQQNARLLEDFATVGDWVSEGSSGTPSITADSTNFKAGVAGLKLEQSGAAGGNCGARKYYSTAQDWSNEETLSLWVYSTKARTEPGRTGTMDHGINVYVSSDNAAGTYSNYKIATLGTTNSGTLTRGWQIWQINKAQFTGGAGTLNFANVRNVRYLMTAANSGPSNVASVTLGGLYIGYRARPRIMLTLDDGADSQYDRVVEANDAGLPVTLYVIPELVDGAGYLTSAQLQTLYAAGNLIAMHAVDSFPSEVDYGATAVDDARAFLEGIGVTDGQYHVAYPGGQKNDLVESAMAAKGVKTARTLQGIGYSAGPPEITASIGSWPYLAHTLGVENPYAINARSLNAATSSATVISEIDVAITRGVSLVLYGHTFVASSASGNDWLNSEWTALIAALVTRRSQGLIDCVTAAEWYDGLAGKRIPVSRVA